MLTFLMLLAGISILRKHSVSCNLARLGDFPQPDFRKIIKLSSLGSFGAFTEVHHNFGKVPFHVRVYAYSRDGDNANFLFDGVGACQNDGRGSGAYGGVLFAYNREVIRLWAPTNNGRVIFVGEGWGGNMHSQSSLEAEIGIDAWKDGPGASFEKQLQIHTRNFRVQLEHPLLQYPDFISIRVSALKKKDGDFIFHAVGASQASSQSRSVGGVIYAYNDRKLVFWTPNKSKSGCIHIGKRWGNGKYTGGLVQNCTIHIRLWVNSFPLPTFQTDWTVYHANKHELSYIDIKHNLKIVPSYVRVKYRYPNTTHSLIFEGTGSAQATPISRNRYGGILYAYSNTYVRLWLPTSPTKGQAFVIFVGDGWGVSNENISSTSAEIKVEVYTDRCHDSKKVVDAQGFCRDINNTHLVQEVTNWGKCSNPCGIGTKTRDVKDCIGRGLKTVIDCKFDNGLCGFQGEVLPWVTTTGTIRKATHLPTQGPTKGSYFVYSDTKNVKYGDQAHLVSPDLGVQKGCILMFKYATESYFGKLKIDVKTSSTSFKTDVWHMTDSQVMKSVWRKGYINFGREVGDIRQFRFTQAFVNKCPSECHPIAITNIVLQCEKEDSYPLSSKQCKEKESTQASCLMNVFQPYAKGQAWSILPAQNAQNNTLGMFVTAAGRKGDLIAIYKFHVKKKGQYQLWVDTFALDKDDNAVVVQIASSKKYNHDFIYNRENALWLPFSVSFTLQAGTFYLQLFQSEVHFRYKNLMIAPSTIELWSDLGLQNRLIPDSSITNGRYSEHHEFSRLNGIGAWMSTNVNKGMFYLQVQLPELALINKIATQGGKKIADIPEEDSWYCSTDAYKIKFSLDGSSFAFYRANVLKDVHTFTGNNDKQEDQIVEHELAYALVARAVRFYPVQFKIAGCMRVELYGYYMSTSMCTKVNVQVREKACKGDGDCRYQNAQCELNEVTNTSECACTDRYHGDTCQLAGCNPNPCKNNATCFENVQKFSCMCQAGFKGKYCHIPCPKGSYGVNCLKTCKCEKLQYCNPVTGDCACLPGFFGLLCDKPCTNLTYGQGCQKKCLCKDFEECDHRTGKCQCAAGSHGEKCHLKCPTGAYGKDCSMKCLCLNNGTCNSTDGRCDCTPGWIGEKCGHECASNRYGQGCSHLCQNPKHSRCDKITGHTICEAGFTGIHCRYPCVQGRYGDDCAKKCSCDDEHTESCDRKTGKCNCKPGYTGETCDTKCKNGWGPHCKFECKCTHGSCDPYTGTCVCESGYLGKYCESHCKPGFFGDGCYGICNCTGKNTIECQPQDGFCRCETGFQGKTCDKKCSQNRWGRNCINRCKCLNGGVCDHRDGLCYCQPGYQGPFCGEECNEGMYGRYCANVCLCKNNAYCDSVDGHCECDPGYIGNYCQSKCKESSYGLHCSHKCACIKAHTEDCNFVNGSCSCTPGFQGRFCEKDCNDGYYGQSCALKCPCLHSKVPCDKVDGNCTCTPGYVGSKCEDDCDWSHYGERCGEQCLCSATELCNNVNGKCFDKSTYTFNLTLRVNADIFTMVHAKAFLKKNAEHIMRRCFKEFMNVAANFSNGNVSALGHCNMDDNKSVSLNDQKSLDPDLFVIRVVNIRTVYSTSNEEMSAVTLTLMHSLQPVNGLLVEKLLKYVGTQQLSLNLKHPYYTGKWFSSKQSSSWNQGKMKYIVISLAGFGGLMLIFVIGILVRCTTKAKNPAHFKKVKRSSKDVEMPMLLPNNNSLLLAFENPYYDVIAAMGLDDDIEEDYYNPLYDNLLELHSDSEADTDYMYYRAYTANPYRAGHFQYDKDSGFSSGSLI